MASSSSAAAGYVEGDAPIPEPVISSEGEADETESEGETTEEEEPTTSDEQEKQDKYDDRNDPDADQPDILAECDGLVPGEDEDFFYDSEIITMLEQGEDPKTVGKTIKERYEWYYKMMVASKKAFQKVEVAKKKREREAKKAKDKEEKAKKTKEEKTQSFKVSLVLPDATVVQFEVSKAMTTGQFRLEVGTKVMGMSKKATKKMSLFFDTVNLTESPRKTVGFFKDIVEGSRITVKFSLAGGGKRVPILLFPYLSYFFLKAPSTLNPIIPKANNKLRRLGRQERSQKQCHSRSVWRRLTTTSTASGSLVRPRPW